VRHSGQVRTPTGASSREVPYPWVEMKTTRLLAAGLAAVVSAGALTACGGGSSVPGGSVAKVGDQTISTSTYTHWLRIAAISTAQQSDPTAATSGKVPKVTIPDPPDYKQCIADKRATTKTAKGTPKTSDATLKQQCVTSYNQLRDQTMQFLVSSDWISGEAAAQGLKVTDAEVQKSLNTTKKQQFPKKGDFEKYLTSSGMTMTDLLYRVRLDSLSTKLRDKVIKGKDKVTNQQIAAYYAKNKSKFGSPETRDIRIVLTDTEAQANQAKDALDGGQSWKAVAKKFSTDANTKDQGGQLTGVTKGQQDPTLDTAAFSAQQGKLLGPIKGQFGFYVYEVTKISKATQQTEQQASAAIKQSLAQTQQQNALNAFVNDFQGRWRDKTQCAKGYITSDCKNGPKPSTTTTAATPAQ
jgi:foldase protein PrsA